MDQNDTNIAAMKFVEYNRHREELKSRAFFISERGQELRRDYAEARDYPTAGSDTSQGVEFFMAVVAMARDDDTLGDLAEGPMANFMWQYKLTLDETMGLFPREEPWIWIRSLLTPPADR